MRDRIEFTPLAPYPQDATIIQLHIGDVANALRTLDARLAKLIERIDPESNPLLTDELRHGVAAVRNDLLRDAADTLARLAFITDEDILRRHIELVDLSERLACRG